MRYSKVATSEFAYRALARAISFPFALDDDSFCPRSAVVGDLPRTHLKPTRAVGESSPMKSV